VNHVQDEVTENMQSFRRRRRTASGRDVARLGSGTQNLGFHPVSLDTRWSWVTTSAAMSHVSTRRGDDSIDDTLRPRASL
jgi:hypothetical protein